MKSLHLLSITVIFMSIQIIGNALDSLPESKYVAEHPECALKILNEYKKYLEEKLGKVEQIITDADVNYGENPSIIFNLFTKKMEEAVKLVEEKTKKTHNELQELYEKDLKNLQEFHKIEEAKIRDKQAALQKKHDKEWKIAHELIQNRLHASQAFGPFQDGLTEDMNQESTILSQAHRLAIEKTDAELKALNKHYKTEQETLTAQHKYNLAQLDALEKKVDDKEQKIAARFQIAFINEKLDTAPYDDHKTYIAHNDTNPQTASQTSLRIIIEKSKKSLTIEGNVDDTGEFVSNEPIMQVMNLMLQKHLQKQKNNSAPHDSKKLVIGAYTFEETLRIDKFTIIAGWFSSKHLHNIRLVGTINDEKFCDAQEEYRERKRQKMLKDPSASNTKETI